MPIKFNKLLNENRYIGGPFDVESLVENLLGQLAGNQAILVNVYDMTNASDPLIMYGDQNQDGDTSLLHESELDFGDSFRKHKMICRQVRLVSGHYLKMCMSEFREFSDRDIDYIELYADIIRKHLHHGQHSPPHSFSL